MTDLLPCPFCGGKPRVSSRTQDERMGYCRVVRIECACGVGLSVVDSTDKNGWSNAKAGETETRARLKWNTRVKHD